MSLPSNQDPSRPLHLAVRSTRILGIIGLLFGGLIFIGTIMTYRANRLNSAMQLAVELGMSLIYLGFGVAFLVFASAIHKQRLWAMYATMAVSGLVLGMIAIGLLGSMLGITRGAGAYYFYVTLVIQLLFAAAFTQLMYHLTKARAFVMTQGERVHGFSPIMSKPVKPPRSN